MSQISFLIIYFCTVNDLDTYDCHCMSDRLLSGDWNIKFTLTQRASCQRRSLHRWIVCMWMCLNEWLSGLWPADGAAFQCASANTSSLTASVSAEGLRVCCVETLNSKLNITTDSYYFCHIFMLTLVETHPCGATAVTFTSLTNNLVSYHDSLLYFIQ